MTDPATQWLRDCELLRQLLQRYARAVDARDIDAVGALFHPGGHVDGARGSASVPDYLQGMRIAPRVFPQSMHVLGDPLIELAPGADRGRMDTYAVVYQLRAPDEPGDDMMLGVRYIDDVVRHDDTWLIRHRQATTIWSRRLPR